MWTSMYPQRHSWPGWKCYRSVFTTINSLYHTISAIYSQYRPTSTSRFIMPGSLHSFTLPFQSVPRMLSAHALKVIATLKAVNRPFHFTTSYRLTRIMATSTLIHGVICDPPHSGPHCGTVVLLSRSIAPKSRIKVTLTRRLQLWFDFDSTQGW